MISEAAAAKGVNFEFIREGGNHTVYRCGRQNVIIARHREINELTAHGTLRDLEDILGEEWWK